jgi:hypothetical protein
MQANSNYHLWLAEQLERRSYYLWFLGQDSPAVDGREQ